MKFFLLLVVAASTTVLAGDYTSPYGRWSGQSQFKATIKGTPDLAAHSVVELIINIDPRGKVTGVSQENGCQLLGIASPGTNQKYVDINLSLSNCRYAGLNQPYRGSFSVTEREGYASLRLSALINDPRGWINGFSIDSTMRR